MCSADKMDLRESQGWLSRGYEGADWRRSWGGDYRLQLQFGSNPGVGLAAGLVGMAADAMVEDVNYTMITDVQIGKNQNTGSD
jgi:hypothetical protein